ncbi:MAG: MiaB/RimO family radical SAM methylthiotransferase [Acidimicrobiales bacterium]
MARKFFVRTFGCQMNEHDSERIAAELVAAGLERTDDPEQADVVVLNTCCIRENADTKLYGHLGQLKSLADRRPGLQIAVGGCLAQKEREAILARAPHVAVVFGTHNVGRVAELLDEARSAEHPVIEILEAPLDAADAFPPAQLVRPDLPYAAWVTIQIGCDNSCAFCVVPSVRGREQSRPFGELVDEVRGLAARGTTEVTLLGQNVNSYGRDLALRLKEAPESRGDEVRLAGTAWADEARRGPRPLFADLLREVGSVEGIRRVRFTSPHPKDLRPETIEAMAATAAICEQLHLPLQSGSDRVLAAMRRGYTVRRYLDRLARARAAIPDLAVTTDVIVGFPGETDDEFNETLAVVAEAGYDGAFTFIFSPRAGTRAAEMVEDFVAPDVIAERFARLKAVVDRSALQRNRARLGRVEEVVVEGPSRKDARVLAGRTRQGKLVHFDPGAEPMARGSYGTVRITSVGPHHLAGDLESREGPVASVRWRPSIPVAAD